MRFPRAPSASHSREWAAPTRCAKPLYQRPRRAGRLPPSVSPRDAGRLAHRARRPAKARALRDVAAKNRASVLISAVMRAGRGLTGTVGLSLSADAARVTPKPRSQRAREPESRRAGEPAHGKLQYDDQDGLPAIAAPALRSGRRRWGCTPAASLQLRAHCCYGSRQRGRLHTENSVTHEPTAAHLKVY